MRNIIKILFFIMLIFFINFFFYFTSQDYRFFLKKLKDKDAVVYLEDKKIDDSFSSDEDILNESVIKIDRKEHAPAKNIGEKKVILGKNYKDLIELFSSYDLHYLEINSNLFDITDEYPDQYYEYYSSQLSLYLFTTKTYQELLDIFSVLEYELPFEVNQVNNFGEKSFYVNLNSDISDNYIRMVIAHKGIAFGLKIKKDQYDSVKGVLLDFLQK